MKFIKIADTHIQPAFICRFHYGPVDVKYLKDGDADHELVCYFIDCDKRFFKGTKEQVNAWADIILASMEDTD